MPLKLSCHLIEINIFLFYFVFLLNLKIFGKMEKWNDYNHKINFFRILIFENFQGR